MPTHQSGFLGLYDRLPTIKVCTAYRLGGVTIDAFPSDSAQLANAAS